MSGWDETIDLYLDWQRARRLTASYVKRSGGYLREFAAMMMKRGRRDARSVTAADALAWRSHLVTERKAKGYVRRGRLISARQAEKLFFISRKFFAWLEEESLILLDPFRNVAAPDVPRTLPREILESDEVRRFLEAPDISTPLGMRNRAILEVMYSTGLRRSEVVGLKLQDVNLTKGLLFVDQGKGRKDRIVPLGESACRWVRRYLTEARPELETSGPCESLWLGGFKKDTGAPMSGGVLGRVVAMYRKRAKIERRVTCHGIRHTMATHMVREGAGIPVVQRILGHRSLASTQVYTRVTVSDLKAVHRRTHPRGKPLSESCVTIEG